MNPPNTFRVAQETQYVLFGVLFAGSAIFYKRQCVWGTLVWFGILAVLKAFVDAPGEFWEFFLGRSFNVIPLDTFITIVLYLDLAFVVFVVRRSGGSELSCFTPLYFMLPTFALLIFGASLRVYIFAGIAIAAFGITLFRDSANFHSAWLSNDPEKKRLVRRTRGSNVFVSFACVFIVMFIDYKGRRLRTEPKAQEEKETVATAPDDSKLAKNKNRAPAQYSPKPQPSEVKPSASPTSPTQRIPSAPETSPALLPSPNSAPQISPSENVVVPPPPSAADLDSDPRSTTVSYTEFLRPFYHSKLSSKRRSALLRGRIGTEIHWKVQFVRYTQTKKEFYIFFSRTDGRALPKPAPVSLAKLSKSNASFVYSLEGGATIELIGRIQRHSDSQVFIQVSEIH